MVDRLVSAPFKVLCEVVAEAEVTAAAVVLAALVVDAPEV